MHHAEIMIVANKRMKIHHARILRAIYLVCSQYPMTVYLSPPSMARCRYFRRLDNILPRMLCFVSLDSITPLVAPRLQNSPSQQRKLSARSPPPHFVLHARCGYVRDSPRRGVWTGRVKAVGFRGASPERERLQGQACGELDGRQQPEQGKLSSHRPRFVARQWRADLD